MADHRTNSPAQTRVTKRQLSARTSNEHERAVYPMCTSQARNGHGETHGHADHTRRRGSGARADSRLAVLNYLWSVERESCAGGFMVRPIDALLRDYVSGPARTAGFRKKARNYVIGEDTS